MRKGNSPLGLKKQTARTETLLAETEDRGKREMGVMLWPAVDLRK